MGTWYQIELSRCLQILAAAGFLPRDRNHQSGHGCVMLCPRNCGVAMVRKRQVWSFMESIAI